MYDYDDIEEVEFLSDEEQALLDQKVREVQEAALIEAMAQNFEVGARHLEQALGRDLSKAEVNTLIDAAISSADEDFDVTSSYVDHVESGAIQPVDLSDDEQRVDHMVELIDKGQQNEAQGHAPLPEPNF